MRCDRLFEILFRTMVPSFPNVPMVPNIVCLGGDASRVLPRHFPRSSIDAIYINFPQPPDNRRTAAVSLQNDGKHLYTSGFLRELLDILREGGSLTLVTDNFPYAEFLTLQFATTCTSSHCFISIPIAMNDITLERRVEVKLNAGEVPRGTVDLLRGAPDERIGHCRDNSSYFDRLWENGHKTERWLLYLQKVKMNEEY